MSEIIKINLSDKTVREYLEIIINGSEEDPVIKQFNESINKIGNRSQAKAIIAALGYVCRDCKFYIEAGKKNSQPDTQQYVRVDFYKNIPVFKSLTTAIRNDCFNANEANFRNPENSTSDTSDFDDNFDKITKGITPNSSLKDFFNQIWKYVKNKKKKNMKRFIKEAFGINMDDKDIKEIVKNKINTYKHGQIIFTGAPGTGKTYSVLDYVEKETGNDKSRYEFVQFHSSYDYTDFVEGLRPVPKNEGENMFVRMDGTFKAFCRTIVEKNKEEEKEGKEHPEYYFIIDEINRADLSKVFGELMFGLEESYRGEKHRFTTQYHNLPTYHMVNGKAERIEDDCFKEGFYIPENLTIIGTMNDIDRSVETFDFALRRRFQWIEIKANEIMGKSLADINSVKKEKIEKIADNIKNMNKIMSEEEKYKKLGLNESYHIGPAYFKGLSLNEDGYADNLDTIFEERIEPLLREYTRGKDSATVNNFIADCEKKLKKLMKEDTAAPAQNK